MSFNSVVNDGMEEIAGSLEALRAKHGPRAVTLGTYAYRTRRIIDWLAASNVPEQRVLAILEHNADLQAHLCVAWDVDAALTMRIREGLYQQAKMATADAVAEQSKGNTDEH